MKIDNNVPAIVRDACIYIIFCNVDLLPTGSEEREVLGFGSIPVAKLPSCQDMNHIALQLHEHEYSWVVKIRNTSEAVLRSQYSPRLLY